MTALSVGSALRCPAAPSRGAQGTAEHGRTQLGALSRARARADAPAPPPSALGSSAVAAPRHVGCTVAVPRPRRATPLPPHRPRSDLVRAAHTSAADAMLEVMPEGPSSPEVQARVVAFVEQTGSSPFPFPGAVAAAIQSKYPGTPRWEEVMQHMARRMNWLNLGLHMEVFTDQDFKDGNQAVVAALDKADLCISIGVQDAAFAQQITAASLHVPTALALDSAEDLEAASRLLFQPVNPLLDQVSKLMPWSQANKDAQLMATAKELFERKNPNDLLFLMLVVLNACVTPVASAAETSKGLPVILCMLQNCRKEVVGCVQDPDCKAALDCLEGCGLNDQVCSYRCITSHETPLFEQFSLCTLTRHNCLNNSAQKPEYPVVGPMPTFRGAALTHEMAEQIFIGWMDPTAGPTPGGGGAATAAAPLEWSWKVVCGVNPAYDYFPCQHQIFYHLKGGKSFWYDPVFKVTTMSGEEVWRRRHYRVKRSGVPGTFYFSVLDNGVTSLEFWRIVDVADDLSWAVFYYAGAATAAGQAYAGAVFCTPDGMWPAEEHWERVAAAHAQCGIKLWELYQVDNSCCNGAPLGLLDA